MKGDFHVRFRENLRVKLPWVTRLCTRRGTRLRRRDAADDTTLDFADLYADRQTVKQNQNNIRTTIISRGETMVTSQLYCTATYHN
jgi:hypothetical protein